MSDTDSETNVEAALLRASIGIVEPRSLTRETWSSWAWVAGDQRMTPSFFALAQSCVDRADPGDMDTALNLLCDVMMAQVMIEYHLVGAAKIFQHHEIDFRVLKGVATAHLDYADPSLRQFGDADILVHPRNLQRALKALEPSGWNQPYPIPHAHLPFAHAVTLRSAVGVELDLHQRVAHRALGLRMPTDEMFGSSEEFEVGGFTFQALGRQDRLIHAALHAATSREPYRRLSSVADVLVMANADPSDAGDTLALAGARGLHEIVVRAVNDAHLAARVPLPDAWIRAFAEVALERRSDRVARVHLSATRRPVLEELMYMREMTGWSKPIRYLWGYFFPGRDYSVRRRRDLRQQVRYLWSRSRQN